MKINRDIFRQIASLRLTTPHLATGPRQGDRRSPRRGRGVEFADYRPYMPGDDLRLVDWNVYARLEVLLVRLFHEDVNLSVRVWVDASASMGFGEPRKADHAAELGAAIALIGLLQQDAVTLRCLGGEGPRMEVRGQNSDAFAEVLRLLRETEPAGAPTPWRALSQGTRRGRTDRLFLISDMLWDDDAIESTLRVAARASKAPVVVHVLSEEELSPDLRDAQRVTDAETGEEILLEAGRADAYEEALAAWLDGVQQACRKHHVQYLPVYTDVGVAETLTQMMRRAAITEPKTGGGA